MTRPSYLAGVSAVMNAAGMQKTAASNYLQDFAAGLDPMGVFSSRYGGEAEREGISEGQHALKRGLGTAGGILGGGIAVPSAIFGATEAFKGFAGAKGGLGKRLGAAVTSGIEGAQKPVKSVLSGGRALRGAQRVAEGGTGFTGKEIDSLKYLAPQMPLGALQEMMPASGTVDKLKDIASRGVRRSDLPKDVPRDFDFGALKGHAGDVRQRLQHGFSPEDIQRGAQLSVDPLKRALGGGVAQLGIGAGIVGGGAYMQYGLGRQNERDTSIGSRLKRKMGFGS